MNTKKLVFTSVMAALCCAGTLFVHIPIAGGGFVHLGDGFVLLSGILLGPVLGPCAAGIGSMLADILLGYSFYAPATLIIKALAALLGYYAFTLIKMLFKKENQGVFHHVLLFFFLFLTCNITITAGYFVYESQFLSLGWGALKNIPPNMIQCLFGIITCSLLIPAMGRIPVLSDTFPLRK